MELKKNDIIELEITALSSEGSGIGRYQDSIVIFVPDTAVGDKLKVRILKVKKTHAFGKIEEIIEESPQRTEPQCSVSRLCGGCVFSHITYEAELEAKHQRVMDALTRIGDIHTNLKPIVGSESSCRYRNKAQIPVGLNRDGEVVMGFFSRHSHRIVDCCDCALQPEIFLSVSATLRKFIEDNNIPVYNEDTHTGIIRHLYMRFGEACDELMVCVVVNADTLPFEELLVSNLLREVPQIKSVIINSNKEKTNVVLGNKFRTIYGDSYITDELCSLKFRLSPQSFYQVNRKQAQVLYSIARDYAQVTNEDILVDLYCGTGTIGLSMASSVKTLIGVEIVPKAIENAKMNAKLNDIHNARFICGDASAAAKKLKEEGIQPDVVIIDPPRKGCDSALLDTIAQMNPRRVVYVSCDPATLARDLKIFSQLGFETQEITPVDMFPRTAHVECVAKLSRTAQ